MVAVHGLKLETRNWKVEIWQGRNELCYVAQRWCIKCTLHADFEAKVEAEFNKMIERITDGN